jgi:two-component system cell cycle sensor histidine kinase/response regulator CckA
LELVVMDEKVYDKTGEEAAFFRTLIESMRDPVYVLDPNDGFRMVYANRAACLHFGVDKEQLFAMRIPDWDPVFDMENIDTLMDELKKGKQMHFETVHRISSGEMIPVEVTCNYLKYEGKEFTAGYFYDIRERKAMETALRESERNLIEAQRIAHVGNWSWDISGNFISASEECYRILGFSKEEFPATSESFMKIIHPKDRDKYSAAVENLMSTFIPYSTQYRIIPRTGTERIIHEKRELVFDNLGNPVSVIGTVQDVTERKREEEALSKSEERYFLAVDGANDGIWERDLKTNEVYFSPRWKSMLGYEDQELPNNISEWKKRIHPDDLKRVIYAGKAYLDGYLPNYEIEYRLRHRDGSYRWILTRGSCLRDSYGIPYRIAGSHTDITSRKIAEDTRRQNEALFRAVLETLPVGIWILEKDGTIALSNEAARKIWGGAHYVGIDRFDMYKGWWHDTGQPISREEWGGARAIRKGETSLGEIIDIQSFDGNRKTIVHSAVPLRNDEGEISAAVIVNEDITELKCTEKSLKESEKKFRTLFEESKDVIFISDLRKRIIDINRAGIELFGYTNKELLSLDPERLYCNPEDRKRLWQKLEVNGYVKDFEANINRKNGEKLTAHLSVSTIKDDSGQISGYQGIIHDVTERRKLERQLVQAQKMESIGVLAGGVAHDFNNLLTAISGYGQILREGISPGDSLLIESAGQILKAAERAAELTRSLLAFSRRQVMNPKPLLLETLIDNTGELIRRIIGEDIEFKTSIYDKNLLIRGDTGQIEQVLMNLATNARDAMPNGGRLSITIRRAVISEGDERQFDLPASGEYALISVTDTGVGIDDKSMGRLFEPFYTTKEIGKGTGLGLSIVHGIIKQHNGSVLVSSEKGDGTTFRIYLPLTECHVVEDLPVISKPITGGTETLLVAEDEEVVKAYLKRILEKAGYKVITSTDGEDAVMKFRKHKDEISLVLADVVMPKKNGREIVDEIVKLRPGIKVVFISGYPADIVQNRGILEKGADIISKPFLKDDLLHKLREVLDNQ